MGVAFCILNIILFKYFFYETFIKTTNKKDNDRKYYFY